MMRTVPRSIGMAAVVGLSLAACGGSDDAGGDEPRVVVTSSILGDVVQELVGPDVEVTVLMPPNVDPHDFAPSAQQAADLRLADVVVQNGGGFEAGLEDTIEAARDDGATVLTAVDDADLLPAASGEEPDPHFFTDPVRMRSVAAALGEDLAEAIPALDSASGRARVEAYLGELEALDAEMAATLEAVPADRRLLVTNHEVFAYFADRYGFEVLGAVIPSVSTLAEPSARELRDLAAEIEAAGVPAIFAETSSPDRLAEALAAEGTDVEVVDLYTESLGPPDSDASTYLEMLRTDAARIAAALAPGSAG